jgi:hypothetical protein
MCSFFIRASVAHRSQANQPVTEAGAVVAAASRMHAARTVRANAAALNRVIPAPPGRQRVALPALSSTCDDPFRKSRPDEDAATREAQAQLRAHQLRRM